MASSYLNFSRLPEEDFDDIIINRLGGRRYTDDPSVSEQNCDYIIDNILIELKIIEEEPLEKDTKQTKLASLFRSDIKTVILNPMDLKDIKKRQYYKILYTPIKTALRKASSQLKNSSSKGEYKIAIIVNNGLSVTNPHEFFNLSHDRAKNDTSNIDTLIVCGVYNYSDGFDTVANIFYREVEIQMRKRPTQFFLYLEVAWNQLEEKYMTEQVINHNMQRNKAPIGDTYFERNGIRYIKPAEQWGSESTFFGIKGRPRNDSTGITVYPTVGIILPCFDDESYSYAMDNILLSDRYLLKKSIDKYHLCWKKKKKVTLI